MTHGALSRQQTLPSVSVLESGSVKTWVLVLSTNRLPHSGPQAHREEDGPDRLPRPPWTPSPLRWTAPPSSIAAPQQMVGIRGPADLGPGRGSGQPKQATTRAVTESDARTVPEQVSQAERLFRPRGRLGGGGGRMDPQTRWYLHELLIQQAGLRTIMTGRFLRQMPYPDSILGEGRVSGGTGVALTPPRPCPRPRPRGPGRLPAPPPAQFPQPSRPPSC